MESAKRICFSTIYGVKDCFFGMSSLKHLLSAQSESESRQDRRRTSPGQTYSQSTVKDKFFDCCVFGIYFWLSNLVFNYVMTNFLFLLFVQWHGEELDSSGVIWIQRGVYACFCTFWIFPLFVLSKLLNFIWYQDIADMIFIKSGLKRNTNVRISDFIADLLKSLILQMFYICQAYAVFYLPLPTVLQHTWYLFHLALLTSLYAFEYKWVQLGLPLPRRLLNINRKWPYFLGFGLPLAIITICFESFIDSMIVFAILFPLLLISSAATLESKSPLCSHPINTFRIADYVAEFLITFPLKLFSIGVSILRR